MSYQNFDAVVTITDQGINESIKQFLRWRSPGLFPYRVYHRFDLVDPAIDLKLEIPLPAVHFNGSKSKNGIHLRATAIGSADDKTIAITITVIVDYVMNDDHVGLKFRDLVIEIDDEHEVTELSLAATLQGHLETLRYLLHDVPLFGDYLNFIPIFSTRTVPIGPKPSLELRIEKFRLLTDSEGLFMGSNEIQLRGKLEKFTRGIGEADLIGEFGVPYMEGVEENDEKNINQRLVFPRPAIGDHLLITCEMIEIDTFERDYFQKIEARYVVEKDEVYGIHLRRIGHILTYLPNAPFDTIPNTNQAPGVVAFGNSFSLFPPLAGDEDDKYLEYGVEFRLENLVGRVGSFALPADGFNIESGKMVVQGALKELGSISFGFTLWNEIELGYKWSHLMVDPAIVDPENLATGFLIETELAGKKLSYELPTNTSNWVALPGVSNYEFTLIPDQRLVNGENNDVRNYKVKLYRYLDAEKQQKELLGEKSWKEEEGTEPATAYNLIPDIGIFLVEGDGFGVQFKTELISSKDDGGADIPIKAVDVESDISVSLSQRLINKLIDLHAPTTPSLFAMHEDKNGFDAFMVMERIGNPSLTFERITNPLDVVFKTASDDTLIIKQKIKIKGHVFSDYLGLFSGYFDSGEEYELVIRASPVLVSDGYTSKLELRGLETNVEGLFIRLLASYGNSLSFIEKWFFSFLLAPATIGASLSHVLNIDGIVLSDIINDELEGLSYHPDDYSFPSTGKAAINKIYWVKDNILERISLDGDHRKMVPTSVQYSFNHLAANHQLNRLYWVEGNQIRYALSDGTGDGFIGVTNATVLTFDLFYSTEKPAQLYFVEGTSIYRIGANGESTSEKLITAQETPTSLVVDSNFGFIFWTTDSGIYRCSISLLQEEAMRTGLSKTSQIAMDHNASKILWTDHAGSIIKSMGLDGSNETDVVTGADVSDYGLQVDPNTGKIYWQDVTEQALRWVSIDGSTSDTLTDLKGISAFTLLLYPGVLGWVSYAKGFQMAIRPNGLALTNVAMSFGCKFEVNIGGDNFGIYGSTHMTVGIDKTTSPLAIDDSERKHMRDRLLDWMEYANIAFDIVPYNQNPWIKITWEEDTATPGTIGSIEGLMDDGVKLRLNPSYLWRTSTDIGSPNPEYRLSYNFWMAHMLGHALGIYNPVEPIEDNDDEGPIMEELKDVYRDDYLLRVEDVQAVQGLFGKRPIPFRPEVTDEATLETSMRNALSSISKNVVYRKAIQEKNNHQLNNGEVSFHIYLERVDISRHEDDGGWFSNNKAEYEMKFSAQLGARQNYRFDRGRIDIPLDRKVEEFNHEFTPPFQPEKFKYSDVISGNLNFRMHAWINAVDDVDADHAAQNTYTIPLNKIGNVWNQLIDKFNNQSPQSNPPELIAEMSTGLWVRESHEPFAIFVVFKVVAKIPSYLNKIKIAEGQRQATEVALKQSMPQQAVNFVEQVKQSLINYAEKNIQQVKDEVDQYVRDLLNEIIAKVDQELDITDQNAIATQASNLAWDLYRQAYPTPESREREIFDQIVQEELLDVADELLESINAMLPESFSDYLLDNVLNQNSPTALGYLKEQWGQIQPYLFSGVSHATARRIITPRLEALRPQVKARATSQVNWLVSKSKQLEKLPSSLTIEANKNGGITSDHYTIKNYVKKVRNVFETEPELQFYIPEFLPIGTTDASVIIPTGGNAAKIDVKINVVDTISPVIKLPMQEIQIGPTGMEGIPASHFRIKRFFDLITANDKANQNIELIKSTPDVFQHGTSEVLITARDKTGNTAYAAVKVTVSPTQYVLYGTDHLKIGDNVVIHSGFIGTDGTTEIVKGEKQPKKQIQLGKDVHLHEGTHVYSDYVHVKDGAKLDLVFCNKLDSRASRINEVVPLPERTVPPMLNAPMFQVGKERLVIAFKPSKKNHLSNGTTIEPGKYGDLVIHKGERDSKNVLYLKPGRYYFKRAQLGDHAQLRFLGRCEIVIAGSFLAGNETYIGPENANESNASEHSIYLVINSRKNRNYSFRVGESSEVFAAVFGGLAHVTLKAGTKATGAFIAKKIVISDNVELTYEPEIAMKIEAIRYLNNCKDSSECAYFIADDENFGNPSERAYGVRLKLAKRILECRDSLPNSVFTSISELDEIYGIGTDTLHDIVNTFSMEG